MKDEQNKRLVESEQNMQGPTQTGTKTSEERQPITITLSVELQKMIEDIHADVMDHPVANALKEVADSIGAKDPKAGAEMQRAWDASFGRATNHADFVTRIIESAHENMRNHKQAKSMVEGFGGKVGMAGMGKARMAMELIETLAGLTPGGNEPRTKGGTPGDVIEFGRPRK